MPKQQETVAVKTYVSPEMKTAWKDHADDLDMNQSEFVQAMVQAGRRKFPIPATDLEQPGSEDATPGVNDLETRVLSILQNKEYVSWQKLIELLAADVEDRLEPTLQKLQDSGQIKSHSKGYTTDGES